MEEHVNELDSSQKTMLELFSDLPDDLRVTIETIKAEMKIQVNLTMRAVGNKIPNQAFIVPSKL